LRERLIYSHLVRSTDDNLGLQLAFDMGGSLAGLMLCLDNVRIELNYRTPSRCYREWLGVGEKTSTCLVTRNEMFYVSHKEDTHRDKDPH